MIIDLILLIAVICLWLGARDLTSVLEERIDFLRDRVKELEGYCGDLDNHVVRVYKSIRDLEDKK